MATQTVINQQTMTPEQQALAKAELEQMNRRMGFEDFMSTILLGGIPGKMSQPAPQPANLPAAIPAKLPMNIGNSALAVQNNNAASDISSLGNIINPPVSNPGSGSGVAAIKNLGSGLIDSATNPRNIGSILGALSGVPNGSTIGRLVGSGIGSYLNRPGEAPTDAVKASSTALPPPSQVTSVKLPVDYSPEGPSGAITAARAQETAMGDMYNSSRQHDIGTTAAEHDTDPGNIYASYYGNAAGAKASQIADAAADAAVAELTARGVDLSSPEAKAFITAQIEAALNPGKSRGAIA